MTDKDREERDAIDAVAEAWASIDGKLEEYREDEGLSPSNPFNRGHYLGYQAEAKEMIERIEKRGFKVVPQ